jgi:hypothetical protein
MRPLYKQMSIAASGRFGRAGQHNYLSALLPDIGARNPLADRNG